MILNLFFIDLFLSNDQEYFRVSLNHVFLQLYLEYSSLPHFQITSPIYLHMDQPMVLFPQQHFAQVKVKMTEWLFLKLAQICLTLECTHPSQNNPLLITSHSFLFVLRQTSLVGF